MRTGITVHLNPTDRKRLQVIVDDRNSPQTHVWHARIVLATTPPLDVPFHAHLGQNPSGELRD
jgi:hypothetical protein